MDDYRSMISNDRLFYNHWISYPYSLLLNETTYFNYELYFKIKM